jgi:hypothetical protein
LGKIDLRDCFLVFFFLVFLVFLSRGGSFRRREEKKKTEKRFPFRSFVLSLSKKKTKKKKVLSTSTERVAIDLAKRLHFYRKSSSSLSLFLSVFVLSTRVSKSPSSLTTTIFNSLLKKKTVSSRKQRVNSIVRMADQAAVSKALEEAIKNAQECVDDCAANWDVVEEISAAQAHAKKEPAAVDAEISKEDLAFIKASQDALKAAKSGEMDKAVLESIETASKSLGKVQGKVKESARLKELSKSLEAALKAAKECTEDCAVEWETVEEISDAKEREQAKGN